MPGSPPLYLASLLALVALNACAAPGKTTPPAAAVLSEPVAPQSTAYTFEYACPHPLVVRISGDSRWRADAGGYAARITALSLGSREFDRSALERINARFPADALQERPWITCLGSSVRIELRVMDRRDGQVSREHRVIFTADSDGRIDFD